MRLKALYEAQQAAQQRQPLKGYFPQTIQSKETYVMRKKMDEMAKTREKYPSKEHLFEALDFGKLASHLSKFTQEQLITSSGAKMVEIDNLYGVGTKETVAEILITFLNDYQNKRDEYKLNEYQIEKISRDLLSRCKQLTIAEFVMMLDKMASGFFGKFYGNMDIQDIYGWACEYMKMRGDVILKNTSIREYLLIREQGVNKAFKPIN